MKAIENSAIGRPDKPPHLLGDRHFNPGWPRQALYRGCPKLLALLAAIVLSATALHGQNEAPHQSRRGTGAIEGRIVGEKSEPIAGARVFIYPSDGPVTGLRVTVYSDSGGAYYFEGLQPGRYTVGADKTSEGYPDMEGDFYNPHPLTWPYPIVDVAEGEVTRGVTIQLGPRAGRFTGRVVDELTGDAIRGGSVSFYHSDDPQKEYFGESLRRQGILDVLVPTSKGFVVAVMVPGYTTCWLGEKGCQKKPFAFKLSSPVTKDFFIALRPSKAD